MLVMPVAKQPDEVPPVRLGAILRCGTTPRAEWPVDRGRVASAVGTLVTSWESAHCGLSVVSGPRMTAAHYLTCGEASPRSARPRVAVDLASTRRAQSPTNEGI